MCSPASARYSVRVTVRVAVPVMRLFQVMDFTGRIMSDKSQMLVTTEIFRTEDYEPKPC